MIRCGVHGLLSSLSRTFLLYLQSGVVPSTVAVLLEDHIEFFDLGRENVPRLPAPYGLEMQRSRTTCSAVVDNCPRQLLMAIRRVAASINGRYMPNTSTWPITGGRPSIQDQIAPNLLITGHSDGVVCFWDPTGILRSYFEIHELVNRSSLIMYA